MLFGICLALKEMLIQIYKPHSKMMSSLHTISILKCVVFFLSICSEEQIYSKFTRGIEMLKSNYLM